MIPLIFSYLDIIECDLDTRMAVERYMRLIVDRSRGHLMTNAAWMRQQILSHPAYAKDSVVTQEIAFDVLQRCRAVSEGKDAAPKLLGTYASGSAAAATAAAAAASASPTAEEPDPDAGAGAGAGAAGGKPVHRRLRGGSFAEEVFTDSQCDVVRGIVSHYTVAKSFAETPAFLRFPSEDGAGK